MISKYTALGYCSEKCLMLLHMKCHGAKQMEIRFNFNLKEKNSSSIKETLKIPPHCQSRRKILFRQNAAARNVNHSAKRTEAVAETTIPQNLKTTIRMFCDCQQGQDYSIVLYQIRKCLALKRNSDWTTVCLRIIWWVHCKEELETIFVVFTSLNIKNNQGSTLWIPAFLA